MLSRLNASDDALDTADSATIIVRIYGGNFAKADGCRRLGIPLASAQQDAKDQEPSRWVIENVQKYGH